MPVDIRLRMEGSTNNPKYRIVVIDSRMPRDGKFIEIVGNYDPIKKKSNINIERVEEWIKKGAKPSPRVKSLLKTKK